MVSQVEMRPTSNDTTEGQSELIEEEPFQFILVQAPDNAKNKIMKRLAQSHAVKQALKKKRILQQKSQDNFRGRTSSDMIRNLVSKRGSFGTLSASLVSPSAGALDPFQALAIDSSRLQTLLGDHKARQAPEPVFSVAEELAFQNFRSVFRTGLIDPALLNAVMLSLAFAVTGGSVDQECLGYRGQAISYIRRKMTSLSDATSESTIGAILLLAGVEARLGMTSLVQVHMQAVLQLLDICKLNGIHLTGGIKRAIFWQDLNTSILAGSSRIVDHTTFAELQWKRDPFSPHFFRLPTGFQTLVHLLDEEFIEVLEDIYALQCIRELPGYTKRDIMLMAHINNHTASIQSRLVELPNLSPVLECCRLAAYVCSVMLCCKVWCALVIPPHISTQLLCKLQQAIDDPIWIDHPNLLLWLIYIGGGFAPTGVARYTYVVLLRSNNSARFGDLYKPWPDLLEILKEFIWSEKAFMPQVKTLWEEAFT